MARKRRPKTFRTPSQRAARWYSKTDANVYAVYLSRVKDLAFKDVSAYQAVHESLISLVKEVTQCDGGEYVRTHAYLWYAQGIWYIVNHFEGKTRQREADALYLYWRLMGLSDALLRIIARKLGVEISPLDVIARDLGIVAVKPTLPAEFPWGMPVVLKGKTLPLMLQAESAGLAITVVARKPDGTSVELPVEDLGDGNYRVTVTFDQEGAWVLEAHFPDGQILKKEIYVVSLGE